MIKDNNLRESRIFIFLVKILIDALSLKMSLYESLEINCVDKMLKFFK